MNLLFFLIVALGLLVAPVAAQEFRGNITGVILDTTGGILPGVSVTVTNVDTNVAVTTVTSARGEYEARFLNPGKYSVTAELDGFKKLVRSGIQVQVGDTLAINLTLETGGITETVQVIAEAPQLNLANGSTGQIISSKQVTELPLGDGTAYMLSQLAPGVSNTTDLKFTRPGDNANLGAFNSNGAKGGNDFSLDGAPNIVSDQRVGFSPPSEAVQEFKVETNSFDAQVGHTAGATVNLALKSGTNSLRGAASYFNRDDSRTSALFFTQREGKPIDPRKYNRFTGMIAGPVVKNKTFVMFSSEILKDRSAEPTMYTVPSVKERTGDFSELLPLGIQIYDPYSAKKVGSAIVRTPFTGNVIPPERIDAIAKKIMAYYPLPNRTGLADGTNNYYSSQDRTYSYNAQLVRVDHNFNANNRVFGTWYRNYRLEDRYNWAGTVNNFDITKGYDNRSNDGVTLGYTRVVKNNLIVDLRGSYQKFGEWREPASTFDPAQLGFPAATLELMRGYQYIPRVDINGYATLGSLRSDYKMGFERPFYTMSFLPTVTAIFGSHSVKAGYDMRYNREKRSDDGYMGGRIYFSTDYTRLNNSVSGQMGQGLAAFMLGVPSSSSSQSLIDVNVDRDHNAMGHALFVQDDWKVSRRFTLNLGLRFEYEIGLREANGQNLRGFDLTSSNPVEAAAKAAYAKAPIAEVPASQFAVRGGLLFTDSANPKAWANTSAVLPRVGGAYQLTEKTVLRGGWGLYTTPFLMDAINQTGYSQPTLIVPTNDSGLTFAANLARPFPSGLGTPPGSSQGLATSNGRDLVTSSASLIQYDRTKARYSRFQVGLQRELPGKIVVEAYYVGLRGSNLGVRTDLNAIPQQYVSTSLARDDNQEKYLSGTVTNPFAGLLPGTSFNGSTIARSQLLKPYPEFGRVAIETYGGSSTYNAGEFRIEKRFSQGFNLLGTYTYSRLRERSSYLNPYDTQLDDRLSPDDRPHRVTAAGIFELPFGRDRKWGKRWNGALDAILGGWQVQGTYQYQSGAPVVFGNSIYYNGDPTTLAATIGKKDASGGIIGVDTPAWDLTNFYFHDATVQTNGVDDFKKQISDKRISLGSGNARYFPSTIGGIRNQAIHLFDLGASKNFRIGSRVRIQARIEAINALNYVVFWNPGTDPTKATFGLFDQQRNLPRDVQLGIKVSF
ncbi:MAG TPA: TonB-dependent receptor [Vicinamibacterales bacterium]